MTIEKFAEIYTSIGFSVVVDTDALIIELDEAKIRVQIDDEWKSSIITYFKAKQFGFDAQRRILTAYRSVEFQVLRLDPSFLARPDFEFSDNKGNIFKLSVATPDFVIALISSAIGSQFTDVIKRRVRRRIESGRLDKNGYVRMRVEEILMFPHTARYIVPRKITTEHLITKGRERIKACLFKLAYSSEECWGLRESIRNGSKPATLEEATDKVIPQANYIDDLVSYYKVAKSSQFPDQEFLSYYHILEYYFLRVSDEIIHTSLKAQINSPSFSANYESINKLLATIKRSDNTSDETEMLKAVLNKFVSEEDLIEHILALEKLANEKTYTDTKKEVFGEKSTIRLEKGHTLSNTAKVIKQIRNSLVHSSDRYNRETCFIPFSESESIVVQYIPIIKFLAEKVIFTTAT